VRRHLFFPSFALYRYKADARESGSIAMNQRTPDKPIPFAPPQKSARPPEGDPLDQSGQAIVAMLQEAVDVAKENCDRALELAHKLSLQLRAAEDRIQQLEGDVRYYQDRATRAEKWMQRIQGEIEDRFFRNGGGNGQGANGHAHGSNGHGSYANGHGANGHAMNGHGASAYAPNGGVPRR
jgi:hypothetical protein